MGKLILLNALKCHEGRAWNVSWHPKGQSLASCGEDKEICVCVESGGTWEKKTRLTGGHSRTIREVNWSPCGNILASASFDATVGIWDKKSGSWNCSASLEGHENEVKSVAWSLDGQLLATCSRDKSVWIWEVGDDDEFECAAVLNAHSQDVKKVKWHPQLELLASASYDNTIKIFKEDPSDNDWTCISTLSGHDSTVWSIAFDKSGSRLVSASDDKTLKVWKEYKPGNKQNIPTQGNDPTWRNVCTVSGYHNRAIYDVSWCHLTGLIATACGDDCIRIFKEVEGCDEDEPSFNLEFICENAHTQDVNAVQWNPVVRGLLASASDDGFVKLWQFHETDD